MMIKIVLADDHKILRDGIKSIIEREHNMRVIGEAENGREALELVAQNKPDMVIMDISMPHLNGIEASAEILKILPATKIIALSMYKDKRYVRKALEAGVSGYLIKSCAGNELIDAINAIYQNNRYFSKEILDIIVDDYTLNFKSPKEITLPELSLREKETLQLIAEGKSAKEISYELGVSVKSIEVYKKSLMEKLGLHTNADLIKYAIREGLSSL